MREVPVVIPSAFDVAGVLCLPEPASAERPAPAMVLLGGSGADTRDGDLGALLAMGVAAPGTLRQVAHALAQRGVASLRWDRRGSGSSGGDAEDADYGTDLEDALACHRWLRSRPEVDPARIAVAGHSAGALVACRLCAAAPDVAGAALLGALASPIEVMLRANEARLRAHWPALRDEQRQWLVRTVPAQLVRTEATEDVVTAAREGRDEVILEGHGVSVAVRLARLRQDLATSYYDEFRHVRAPALVLHGGHDLNVPVGDAPAAFRALRDAGNDRVTLVVLPGLDHYFVPTPADPGERVWERLSLEALRRRPMSEEALGVIVGWARATLRP